MIRNKTVRWTLGDEEYARLLWNERKSLYLDKNATLADVYNIEIELLNIIGEEKLNELMKDKAFGNIRMAYA